MNLLPTGRWARIRVFVEAAVVLGFMVHMQLTGGIVNTISEFPFQFNLIRYRLIERPFDFRVNFFGMVYEGRSGNTLDDLILIYGAQEKSELFFLSDVAEVIGAKNVVFYDIGANVGQHTIFMSQHANMVHSFEPYPPVLKRLYNNISINHLTNVTVHPVGLGEADRSLPFFLPVEGDSGTGSFARSLDQSNKHLDALPIVNGDGYVTSNHLPVPTLIKCDVEGYERFVLEGLKNTIALSRPIVLMEVTPWLDTSFVSPLELLKVFPKDYAVAGFCEANERTGQYRVCAYPGDNFRPKGRQNVIVYPLESKSIVFAHPGL